MPRLVQDVQVNVRSKTLEPLVLDGEDFPFHIDKSRGVKVEAQDGNVHLVTVSIQVDRSVTITDHSLPG